MAKSGIPIKFYDLELEDYTKCPKAKEKIIKYIDKLDDAYKHGVGLYLFGGRGLGKSLLQSIIIKHILKKGYTALYTSLGEIVMMFGDGFYDREARDKYQEEVLQVQFLAIDDIDKTFTSTKSNYVPAAFDQLFRTRSNQLLPTIISSNKKRDDLFTQDDNFYASALSLLSEHLLDVLFTGTDNRIEQISPRITKDFFGDL